MILSSWEWNLNLIWATSGKSVISWLVKASFDNSSSTDHFLIFYPQIAFTDVHLCFCASVTSELVMLSLDLVKTRLSVMNMEMRKNFIQVILTSLIEKSPDPKVLRAVVKIVEEWVKNNSPMASNQVGILKSVHFRNTSLGYMWCSDPILKRLCVCECIGCICYALMALFRGQRALAGWLDPGVLSVSLRQQSRHWEKGAEWSPPDKSEINGLYQSVHPVLAPPFMDIFLFLKTPCNSAFLTHLSFFCPRCLISERSPFCWWKWWPTLRSGFLMTLN